MIYVGVDFSGNHLQWRPRITRSAVWVSETETAGRRFRLNAILRVQDLPGDGGPFLNLARFLNRSEIHAAGIDAPFSIPLTVASSAFSSFSHAELISAVSDLPVQGRPLPHGAQLIDLILREHSPRGKKLYRECETFWVARGVNVRSTTWNGPRGGAAFTVACLRLMHTISRSVWPFSREGTLVEAFPAAQLRHWGITHVGYNGSRSEARAQRAAIWCAVKDRTGIEVSRQADETILDSADALDSVLCALAAKAVVENRISLQLTAASKFEGCISIHP
jgi:hypothetical protein